MSSSSFTLPLWPTPFAHRLSLSRAASSSSPPVPPPPLSLYSLTPWSDLPPWGLRQVGWWACVWACVRKWFLIWCFHFEGCACVTETVACVRPCVGSCGGCIIRVQSLSRVLRGRYSNNTKLLPSYYGSGNKMTHGLSSLRISHRCVGTSFFMSSCFPTGLDTDALTWAEAPLLKLSFHFRLNAIIKKRR